MTDAPPAGWLTRLETDAPDVIACWNALDSTFSGLRALRRELRARVHAGDAPRLFAQQEAVGDELERALRELPVDLLRAPGGEEDWNVAQAFAHTTAARRFLATWAALDVDGEWPDRPEREPVVVPSVPGPADASLEDLLVKLDKSRVAIRQAADRIHGRELNRCRLRHPLVGRLRCGDWLAFVGVHDLMHLEQLDDLARRGALGRGDA
jgi:DinB superfamily